MRVAIGSDHRGTLYKDRIRKQLEALGHTVADMGTTGAGSVDYPDYAGLVARSVACGENDRGVLICSSGIGMSMAANRYRGVRAALCLDAEMARIARRHNNANVLCLGQDLIDESHLAQIVDVWLTTEFDGGRHERRIRKLDQA